MENVTEFKPENDLEAVILEASQQLTDYVRLLTSLLESTICVPSTTPVSKYLNELTPVFFDRDGTQMLAVFSAKSRIRSLVNVAPYVLETKSTAIVKTLQPELGIVVNPGWDVVFDITPQGLLAIRRDFL